MSIELKDILTLDNNKEYVVLAKTIYNNLEYYYMMELKNRDEIKFCYLDGEDLVESLDKELNTTLLQMCLNNLNS